MKRLIAIALLTASATAAAFGWVLISSYYDASVQGWVCTYRSPQGTTITQIQRSICSIQPR